MSEKSEQLRSSPAQSVPQSAEPVILNNGAQPIVKKVNPVLHWFCTWNNYPKDEVEAFYDRCANECEYFNFQEEIGASGTPHIQGAFKLKTKARLGKMKELSHLAHWEQCKNPLAAQQYCRKEGKDGLAPGGKRYIYPPLVKVLPDNLLKPWHHTILGMMKTEATYRDINWIYDPTGNNMKSAFVKKCAYELGTMFITGGKGSDILHMVAEHLEKKYPVNWTLMIDYPRTLEGKVSYPAIEMIKNGFWSSPKYEGKKVIVNHPHIFVFANWLPEITAMTADKWIIWDISDSQMKRWINPQVILD
nr:MAG: replication associated protein [Cressdnaviricota sp.]